MKTSELLAALDAVRPGLAAKETIEHAQSFVFTGEYLVTYNDEISVRMALATDFQGAVPSGPLLNFLKKANADEVTLEPKEAELILKCGRAKAGIPFLASVPEHLTSLKIPTKGWAKLPEGFIKAMEFTAFCASRDMGRPALTCIHLAEGRIEAGDNYRFTRYKVKGDFPKCLFPATSVRELVGFAPTEMIIKDAWCHFRNASGASFSRRINSGTYPNLEPVFEMGGDAPAITFPEKIVAALDRTGIFSTAEVDIDRSVHLTAKGGRLTIRGEGADGWCEEVLSMEGKPEFTFSAHPTLLKEILAHTNKALLADGKLLFSDKTFEHILAL